MEIIKLLFCEINGEFSWRKAMTALTSIAFSVAVIGNQITNDFEEMPVSYLSVIAGVFVFYFGKGLVEGKRIELIDKK